MRSAQRVRTGPILVTIPIDIRWDTMPSERRPRIGNKKAGPAMKNANALASVISFQPCHRVKNHSMQVGCPAELLHILMSTMSPKNSKLVGPLHLWVDLECFPDAAHPLPVRWPHISLTPDSKTDVCPSPQTGSTGL